ncbi:MAG: ABC transporter permease [Bacteroidia bacterium]|nr:ABC transporter permease [Bacteroidia bacterium]
MLRNYFVTALRNLLKQRMYTLINIGGLAVGIACCLLIALFIADELSYDRYHERADRIYRVAASIKFGEMDGNLAVTPAPMGPAMLQDFPEVEASARFRTRGSHLIKAEGAEQNLKEEDVIFADQQIFEIFSFRFLEGDMGSALREPNTAVISRSAAERHFPGQSALGKVLILSNRYSYRVTGVFEDMPASSHIRMDFFLSMTSDEEALNPIWLSFNFYTYVLLKPGTDPRAVEAKFGQMIDTYAGPQLQQFMGVSMTDFLGSGNRLNLYLQPLTDIHLYSDLMAELAPNGSIQYVYIFSVVALFILLIACVNFMNLSTARSANRAKEVGVRKVLGAMRGQLIRQFLVETLLLTAAGFMVALALAELFLPVFNNLSGKSIRLPWHEPVFWASIGGGILLIGCLAGLYPAFFLSAFQPVQVLKGRLASGARSGRLRSALVVFQFSASIALIVCTLMVNRQLNFIRSKELGFNREQVLILQDTYLLRDRFEAFKEALAGLPQVSSVSGSSFIPVRGTNLEYESNNNAFWPEGQKVDKTVILNNWSVDHAYVRTLGMQIVLGRDFSLEFPTDSQGVILNQTAVESFGLGPDPLGKRINTFAFGADPSLPGPPPENSYTVIGVVKDFHYESMRERIAPLGLFLNRSTGCIMLRLQAQDLPGTIGEVEARWREFAAGVPFTYRFLDDEFDRMYQNEQRLGQIFLSFAVLAILVACLGLFALASFMAQQRTKEIGIRKVLGASVTDIIALLSRNFLGLVGIAMVLAFILSGVLMNRWLMEFMYRAPMGAGPFVLAGVLAVAIAMATVSFQAVRAATADPVQAIKEE